MVVSSLSVFAGNQQEAVRQAMELVDVLPLLAPRVHRASNSPCEKRCGRLFGMADLGNFIPGAPVRFGIVEDVFGVALLHQKSYWTAYSIGDQELAGCPLCDEIGTGDGPLITSACHCSSRVSSR